MAITQAPSTAGRTDRPTTLSADGDGRQLLEALNDDACRTILEATGEDARSAAELSETCDIPLSTVYRKLELLEDTGLVREGIRIRRSGKHTSEYRRAVDEVHVTVGDERGIELTLDHTATPA
jgi:DNA-binding transcriptional ArsR family regulator